MTKFELFRDVFLAIALAAESAKGVTEISYERLAKLVIKADADARKTCKKKKAIIP